VRPSGPTGELVVKGEAELAVQQISELLPVAGTEFVGPFPPELQVYTTFTAAVGSSARDSAAARTLLKFLIAPDALPVIKAKGMEPA
jgi:molybdate transport system substrate-binding protein